MMFFLPHDLTERGTGMVTANHDQESFEIPDFCEGFSRHPDFQKYILQNFLCQFRRLSNPVEVTCKMLVPLMKQLRKRRFVTSGSPEQEVAFII